MGLWVEVTVVVVCSLKLCCDFHTVQVLEMPLPVSCMKSST